jgi:hypothetical protein
MNKPNQNSTITELRAYIKAKKLNHPLIKLGLKKSELQAGLKKIGHWEEKAKIKKTRKKAEPKPSGKKKIAILLSGRLTSYDKHYKNIMENLVQDYDVDFYAGISEEPINKRLLDGFLKMYNPVAWKYSDKPLLDIDFSKVKSGKNLAPIRKNVMFMWRNRDNVRSLLMKSKVNYDWIISTRADVFYKNKLDYNDLDADKINIPEGSDFSGYQDKIAIAKKPLMLEYLDVYDNLKKYVVDDKRTIEPETLQKYHLGKNYKNIPVKRIILKHDIFPKVALKKKQAVAETGQK